MYGQAKEGTRLNDWNGPWLAGNHLRKPPKTWWGQVQ
jgi:hypothetical protein